MIAEKVIAGLLGNRTTRELDALVHAYAKQGRFSGAVLVARAGKVLLRKGYGNAEYDGNWASNTPTTAFRIGSMTKPFTAIAIMQLVEQSRLTLEDTLAKYLPDFPNAERITVQHLLSNRSGIEDYIVGGRYEAIQEHRVSDDELIALFRDQPLRFEPGSEYGYSNSNWLLLALIVERVTGQSFERVIQKSIFVPAGMTDSGLDWSAAQRRATGYIDTGEGLTPSVLIDSSTMRGGGDIHATLDDLQRFAEALMNQQLISPSALNQMRAVVSEINSMGYGLGFEVHRLHNRLTFGHSGGMPGFVANLAIFPDENVTVIVLSNLGSAAWEAITEGLAAIVFGVPYALPTRRAFVSISPDTLKEYTGDYRMQYFGRTAVLRFHIENAQLIMQTQGLPKAQLSALSETTFFCRSKGEVELTFVHEPDGSVQRIDLVWGGHKLGAERTEST